MASSEMIYSATEGDFAAELVGKRIKAITEDSITLNDGTLLLIEGGGGCCAWFAGTARAIDLDDNAIMRVENVERDTVDDHDDHWTINIYTAHKLVAAVDIDGNPTSGYYGSSINLQVRRPS